MLDNKALWWQARKYIGDLLALETKLAQKVGAGTDEPAARLIRGIAELKSFAPLLKTFSEDPPDASPLANFLRRALEDLEGVERPALSTKEGEWKAAAYYLRDLVAAAKAMLDEPVSETASPEFAAFAASPDAKAAETSEAKEPESAPGDGAVEASTSQGATAAETVEAKEPESVPDGGAAEAKVVETKAAETVEATEPESVPGGVAVEAKVVETKAAETSEAKEPDSVPDDGGVEAKVVETKAIETSEAKEPESAPGDGDVEAKVVETKAIETSEAKEPESAPGDGAVETSTSQGATTA
ncbi:MAG: hypothetical protein LBJ64_00820, partial [Deltaproteobacteria bacterium]|nr:hypothetical protein [Deltaproteobacteria bacterium]